MRETCAYPHNKFSQLVCKLDVSTSSSWIEAFGEFYKYSPDILLQVQRYMTVTGLVPEKETSIWRMSSVMVVRAD